MEDRRLREYVAAYSKKHHISAEEALKHKIVQNVKKEYEQQSKEEQLKQSTYTPCGECM